MCGKYAIDGLTHPICQTRDSLDGCFIALEYTGVVRKLIYQFKYKPFVTDIQHMMSELLYEGIIEKEALMHILSLESDRILIPIPLHIKKLRVRGYNHAEILGKHMSRTLHIPLGDHVVRVKETDVQFGLSKEKRKENIKNAFVVKNKEGIEDKTVFLFDDIVTTGVTFVEAAKVLKKAGVKRVYGIAFAGED